MLKTTETTSGIHYNSIIKNPGPVGNNDPVFDNPSNDNYHLWDQSVAIDASEISLQQDTIKFDLDGEPRDASPDLGCYEL